METHFMNKVLHAQLCAMGLHNLTNQQTDLVAQHLKCFDHSKMPEQSLSSKYFSISAS